MALLFSAQKEVKIVFKKRVLIKNLERFFKYHLERQRADF
jgi:hypothetical protein